MAKWCRLRDILRRGEWYAFSVVCFLAGVVAGRVIELHGRPEPVNALVCVGAVVLAYYLTLLVATVMSAVKEEV